MMQGYGCVGTRCQRGQAYAGVGWIIKRLTQPFPFISLFLSLSYVPQLSRLSLFQFSLFLSSFPLFDSENHLKFLKPDQCTLDLQQ
jgi:hypothetical protein